MKIKILLFATLFVFGFQMTNAQTFEKGTKVLNLGVGLGGSYYSGYSGSTHTPLINAAFDVSVKNVFDDKGAIGIGGYFGYQSAKWSSGAYSWTLSNMVIGPRGTLHYQFVDKLDTYAGLLLGYHVVNWKYTGYTVNPDNGSSEVYFSGFVGARYYFSNKFGAYIELGSGALGNANVGVSLKF